MAGATWKSTAALAVAGGPASFIAQNAATREILQAADYSKLADQYDPLDPVGAGTVYPVAARIRCAGHARRQGQSERANARRHTTTRHSTTKMAPPDDLVDAARVDLVREHMDGSNPKPGDLVAADAHSKAYTQALEQQAAGEPVRVDVPEDMGMQASLQMEERFRGCKANRSSARPGRLHGSQSWTHPRQPWRRRPSRATPSFPG